jgi:hypothetical protein
MFSLNAVHSAYFELANDDHAVLLKTLVVIDFIIFCSVLTPEKYGTQQNSMYPSRERRKMVPQSSPHYRD